jgi:hypothetical protein
VPGGTQLEGEARIEVYGANLLVWGLVGADLLGTPGFRDLDNSGTGSNPSDPFGGWMNDTSATFDAAVLGKSGSYALYPANYPDTALRGKPVHTRAAPYVDLSKVRLTKRVGNSGLFEVPAGHSKCKAMCFLDAFDQPLLYYRANPGAPCMAADSRSSDDVVYVTRNGRYAPTGVYDLLDNCVYTGTNAAPGYCSNFGAGNNHPIHRLGNPALKPQDPQFAVQNPRGCFVSCLRDPNVTAATAPHKPDSFVLLSAGADSLYGTADDVANFPVNP